MDLNRTYNNRNLESRRKRLLSTNHAVSILRQRKQRGGADARAQVLAAFDGEDAGPLSALVRVHLGTRKFPIKVAHREALRALLLHVEGESELLDDLESGRGVLALGERRMQWRRAPTDWRARSHNARRQFSALARHLLARYDVPAFMDAAWTIDGSSDRRLHQDWFVHLGRGENLRKAAELPVPLTKLMAHHVLLAPRECTIPQAIRWGQLRGMGVGERVAHAVLGSRVGRSFEYPEREPFWASVFNFFAVNPMIDPNQVGPIIDFLHDQKFVPAGAVNVGGGRFVQQGPPQPGLSMKGRTPDVLVEQVDAWHRQLRRVYSGPNTT